MKFCVLRIGEEIRLRPIHIAFDVREVKSQGAGILELGDCVKLEFALMTCKKTDTI